VTPPENNALIDIKVTLAGQNEVLASLKQGQQEMKVDQKEIKTDQREANKEYSLLATVVNTMQGQVNTMQVQIATQQNQVSGLLAWQLTQAQQHGSDTLTTYERINDVQSGSFKRIITVQAWPLTIVGGVILTAIANQFLHFLH